MPRCPLERANKISHLKARLHRAILSHDKSCNFVTRQVALNFEHVRMAAMCRATNRSEIGGCSHVRFAVAVKSPFVRSSCCASKSLCVNVVRFHSPAGCNQRTCAVSHFGENLLPAAVLAPAVANCANSLFSFFVRIVGNEVE